MALTHLETELVWLTKKVRRDTDLIATAYEFFDEKQQQWSRGVVNLFLMTLEKMQDQLNYEEHRLEMLAWQIVEYREGRSTDIYRLPE